MAELDFPQGQRIKLKFGTKEVIAEVLKSVESKDITVAVKLLTLDNEVFYNACYLTVKQLLSGTKVIS